MGEIGRAELAHRIDRDQRNAEVAAAAANRDVARGRSAVGVADAKSGITELDRERLAHADREFAALDAIAEQPFHAMAEVYTETAAPGGTIEKEQIWYANADAAANQVFRLGPDVVNVLAWTHPGMQLALALPLGEWTDVRANGYRLVGVEPLARARFDAALPTISAVYEPGGAVRPQTRPSAATGLKPVKLDMTADQVRAFVARMSGMMVVTGAPGSGKTTVAFQRIRFLFDQQDAREEGGRLVRYAPELTRVFMANPTLADQARTLLSDGLGIPASVVEPVATLVDRALDTLWGHKLDARPRTRRLVPLEQAARRAVLGLSDQHDLMRLWLRYETQVAGRLAEAPRAAWLDSRPEAADPLGALAGALRVQAERVTPAGMPLRSPLRMDALHRAVARPYNEARAAHPASAREQFDEAFARWLFEAYDPLDTLAGYVAERATEAAHRIRRGTGGRVDEAVMLASAADDWRARLYGDEDRPWLAWLLRYALPEAPTPADRFRAVPWALGPAAPAGERLTHVAVDEAQDLCAAEASLIGSLVDPDGALTVSADFRQVVSPVQGMRDRHAFDIGRTLRGTSLDQIYPFSRNMRQSRQIGRFLQGFYEVAFKERALFEPSPAISDRKPQLLIAPASDHALRIRQLANALKRSEVVRSLAVLQINEDLPAMERLRAELAAGVELAPIWAGAGAGVVTSSVERTKGLEFDAVVVLGLEEVESAALNFTLNRAYVALSRPTRRLVLLCGEFPSLLRRVDRDLFDVSQS